MRLLTLILLVISGFFLLRTLQEVGFSTIGCHIVQVGYYWPMLLLPYGLMSYLWTIAWKCLLVAKGANPSLGWLFCLRIAGESLSQLTPTASMGGEPYKILQLKESGVSWQDATASVIIHKGLLFLSLVVYIFLSLALVPFVLPESASRLAPLSVGALVLAMAGAAFILAQRGNPCVSGVRLLEKCGLCPHRLKAKKDELAGLDAVLAEFYRTHFACGLLAFMFSFLAWVIQGTEVYLIFWLLGHPIGLATALCLDALAMIFTGLGFMIPASLGVQDGGNILLSLGLNLGATLGVAFTIVRRIREAFWLGIGLILAALKRPIPVISSPHH